MTTETHTTLFALIHDIHATITRSIDTSLTWEQLNSPQINYTLVRPIVERLSPAAEDGKADLVQDGLLGVTKGSGKRKGRVVSRGASLGGLLYALMANR